MSVHTNNPFHELHAHFAIYCGLVMAILTDKLQLNFNANETALANMGKWMKWIASWLYKHSKTNPVLIAYGIDSTKWQYYLPTLADCRVICQEFPLSVSLSRETTEIVMVPANEFIRKKHFVCDKYTQIEFMHTKELWDHMIGQEFVYVTEKEVWERKHCR